MKTYYELLGVAQVAGTEEIKRAFRREIARYHPDKVQHLGPEFQAIASERAAALTEAYRILMDAEERRRYDGSLGGEAGAAAERQPPPSAAAGPVRADTPATATQEPPSQPRRVTPEQTTTAEFVRRAVMARLKEAVGALGGTPTPQPSFDAMFEISGRKGLFRSPEPTVRLAVKVVPEVDASAVEQAWGAAARLPAAGDTLCLLLLGSAVAPARDLAAVVSDLRRRTRTPAPIVVPVDVRDWGALFPPDTPPAVRAVVDRLRHGG